MKNAIKQVLVIDDVNAASNELAVGFQRCEDFRFEVKAAANLQQAETLLRNAKFDVVTIDLKLGSNVEAGLELMRNQMLFASCPDALRIVVTAYGNVERCVQAMRMGAWDFIDKEGDYASKVVRSASTRLKELEEAESEERYIIDKWLPEHEQKLQKDFPGKYLAIRNGEIVAHGDTMIALGEKLSDAGHAGERLPYVLYIEKGESNDQG